MARTPSVTFGDTSLKEEGVYQLTVTLRLPPRGSWHGVSRD